MGKRDRERRVFGYTNRGSGVCVGSQVPGDRASPVVSAVASDAFNTTSCLRWTCRTRTATIVPGNVISGVRVGVVFQKINTCQDDIHTTNNIPPCSARAGDVTEPRATLQVARVHTQRPPRDSDFPAQLHEAVRCEMHKRATQHAPPPVRAPQSRPHGRATSRCRAAASPGAGSRRPAAPSRC